MNSSLCLPVHEATQAGEARRRASVWAQERGCGEELTSRLALVVTELGKNLALHTSGGRLVLRRLLAAERHGVQILSLDRGPGVSNFTECLRDGYSTAGTSGIGLGAVQRASQVFAVHSQPGVGTALLSELWNEAPHPATGPRWDSSAVNVPLATEQVCGDSWAELFPRPGVMRLMVADGLGHGEHAAEASNRAAEAFARYPQLALPILLETMDGALRPTRGAAIAVAELDFEKRQVSYAGIGNISGTIIDHQTTTSLVSMNGTVGAQNRGTKLFTYPWPAGAALVMASDGIKTRWHIDQYTGLANRPSALIAGVLFRDFARENDDATVVVARQFS